MDENKLKYRFRILKEASFDRLGNVVDDVSNRCNKSKAEILLDILYCTKKYGSGYNDYLTFQFYDMEDELRDTYMTRIRNKKFVSHVNKDEYTHYFDNKNEFNVLFKDFIKRDFIDVQNDPIEKYEEFFNKHDKGFAKMLDLTCGDGAEIIEMKDFEEPKAFYDYVNEKGFAVIEEVLQNHPDINNIYPDAINTMRMITLIDDDGNPNLLYAAQKFGNEGRFVDAYGLHGPVDCNTGKLRIPFESGDVTKHETYFAHPVTGEKILGFQIPFFEEAKKLVLDASLVIPEVRYIGWDVAITPNGPVIIEGNNYSSYDYFQRPSQNPGRIGILPKIKELVPSFEY